MTDVTLGQYYPADSPLHRLDPRVKLIGTLAFIILAFVAQTFIGAFGCVHADHGLNIQGTAKSFV